MEVESQLAQITQPKHNSSLLDTFRTFNENDILVDLTFVCKGRYKIVAHKLVFAIVSPFLKSCFESECKCQDMVTIMLPDIEPQILNLLLSFLYEGVTHLSNDELEDFKSVVSILGIELPNVIVNEIPRMTSLQENTYNGNQGAHVGVGRAIVVEEDSGLCTRQKFVSLRNNDETDPLNDPLNIPDMYFAGLPPSTATAPVIHNKNPNLHPTTTAQQAPAQDPQRVHEMKRDAAVKRDAMMKRDAVVKQEPKDIETSGLENELDHLNASRTSSREMAPIEYGATSSSYYQPFPTKALPPRPRPSYTDPPSPTGGLIDDRPSKKRRIGRYKRKQTLHPTPDLPTLDPNTL